MMVPERPVSWRPGICVPDTHRDGDGFFGAFIFGAFIYWEQICIFTAFKILSDKNLIFRFCAIIIMNSMMCRLSFGVSREEREKYVQDAKCFMTNELMKNYNII
jgi:hypothetical protein